MDVLRITDVVDVCVVIAIQSSGYYPTEKRRLCIYST
jgi:hypothetical protein